MRYMRMRLVIISVPYSHVVSKDASAAKWLTGNYPANWARDVALQAT